MSMLVSSKWSSTICLFFLVLDCKFGILKGKSEALEKGQGLDFVCATHMPDGGAGNPGPKHQDPLDLAMYSDPCTKPGKNTRMVRLDWGCLKCLVVLCESLVA